MVPNSIQRMNSIISNYPKTAATIVELQKGLQQRKNLFENGEAWDLLMQLNQVEACYKAIYEIANFIDKQQRKIKTEIANLERKHKIDVKITGTNEERGKTRQITTLWNLNTKYSLEREFQVHINYLLQKEEEILTSIVEIQEKLIGAIKDQVSKNNIIEYDED